MLLLTVILIVVVDTQPTQVIKLSGAKDTSIQVSADKTGKSEQHWWVISMSVCQYSGCDIILSFCTMLSLGETGSSGREISVLFL